MLFNFKKIRMRRMYRKMILWFLLLTTVPLLAFSVFSFSFTKEIVNDLLRKQTEMNLSQAITTIEVIVKQISQSCTYMMSESSFREYESFINGRYYEEITREIQSGDVVLLHRYNSLKSAIFNKINVFKLSNDYVHSVYFFDNQKQLLLSDNYGQYSLPEFHNKAWLDVQSETADWPLILDNTGSVNGQLQGVVTLLYRSLSVNDNALIVNLDAARLYESIRLHEQTDSVILVANTENAVILSDNEKFTGEEFFEIIRESAPQIEKRGYFSGRLAGGDLVVFQKWSDELSWQFLIVNSNKGMYWTVILMGWIFAVVLLTCILIVILSVFYSSKQLYKPIDNLLADMASGLELYEEDISEMQYIERNISIAAEKNRSLVEILNQSIPAYRENFLSSLLKGVAYDENFIRERFRIMNIQLELTDLAVAVFSIEKYFDGNDDAGRGMLLGIECKRMIEDLCPHSNVVSQSGDHKFVLILNKTKPLSVVFDLVRDIKDAISRKLNAACIVGVGSPCDSITQVSRAYGEANNALKYAVAVRHDGVIYIKDIIVSEGLSNIKQMKQRCDALAEYIKNSRYDSAKALITDIVLVIKEEDSTIPYVHIRFLMTSILTTLLNTAYEMEISMNDLSGREIDWYGRLHACVSNNEILKLFLEIIDLISGQFIEKIDSTGMRNVKTIKEMIKNDYGSNLSLNGIADNIGLNPIYVSRIFKQYTGKKLIDYLTQYRIQKSMELLTDTDILVKDISLKVGYSNSHYFIKLFKQFTGMTPGDYRAKYHRKNDA